MCDMSQYEEEIKRIIRDTIIDQLDTVSVELHASAVDWMADDMYDALEDELRGPA